MDGWMDGRVGYNDKNGRDQSGLECCFYDCSLFLLDSWSGGGCLYHDIVSFFSVVSGMHALRQCVGGWMKDFGASDGICAFLFY